MLAAIEESPLLHANDHDYQQPPLGVCVPKSALAMLCNPFQAEKVSNHDHTGEQENLCFSRSETPKKRKKRQREGNKNQLKTHTNELEY